MGVGKRGMGNGKQGKIHEKWRNANKNSTNPMRWSGSVLSALFTYCPKQI